MAIKTLSSRSAIDAERLAREGALLAELEHPAIVRYVAHGETHGEMYLVMEWLQGETLQDRLVTGPLSTGDTLTVGIRIADALSLAHRLEIVHRDLKPSNLFLPDGQTDQIKILDFGVARRVTEESRLTQAGTVVGTPMYMAPEQFRSEPDVDEFSDVFCSARCSSSA